jgi:23S rRNA (cytosine1962-C5)-methyltransferase
MTDLPILKLKRNEDRRIRQGHLWIFSNEVDTSNTPLKAFEPGDVVAIEDARGKWLGTGYVNPHSLIAARLVSRDRHYPFDASVIVHRLKVALSLRERLFPGPYYRLVFGESDGLPGLVVDRFDDVLVVQITTAGMERQRHAIVDALVRVVSPATIVLRNDSPVRDLEGLTRYVELALGEMPERLSIVEHGSRFEAPLAGGQKTGWFYDQRDNRARILPWVRGARVLDVFSYVGAWAVQCARAGAAEVVAVDESGPAVARLRDNAARNGVAGGVRVLEGEALSALKGLRDEG